MITDQQERLTLEQQRQTLRDDYDQSIKAFYSLAKVQSRKKKKLAAFQKCHDAALAYFNAHDQAIPADARLKLDRDPTCYTDRADTSVNVLQTICKHYRCLRQWAGDLAIDIIVLQPSLTAFANMQRRVQETNAGLAAQLRADFVELALPTHGFDTREAARPHRDEPVALPAQNTTNNYTFNSPTAGCAFGEGATVKADQVHSHQEGDQIMGDKIHVGGNAIGNAIGRRASVKANDIIAQVQQSGMDNDLKEKLSKAAEIIDALNISEDDKADATENLGKLSEEMQKQAPEPGRVCRLWNHIKDVAPTAASLLASVVSIAKLVSGTP